MRTLLIALGLSICSAVSATTYYVATNGNNSNPGTISAPWATWGHAFNSTAVRPGDTVYFRGGVYQMTSDNLSYPYAPGCGYNVSRDGTSGSYICYFAYPGEKPVLDCGNIVPTGRNSRAIWGNDMNYVHFKGLTVRNVRQTSAEVNVYGWIIEGRNIIVEGCTVHNCGGRGFFSTGHEIRYLNCDSHHNSDAMSASYPGNDGVGFQNVDLTNVDGSIYYKNCRAWMNGDQGFSAVSVGYLEFDGCWSFNNGQLQGEGHGFKMGAVGVDPTPFGPLKRKYTNCVAAFNRANGWTTNDNQTFYTHLMHIYNNTSYHNGYPTSFVGVSYGFIIYNTASVDAEELARTYRNNISYQNQHGATFIGAGAQYTHSNNSWDISGLTITDSDFASLDSTGITAARQSDYTLPNNSCYNNFLKLAPGSRLIDAGVNVSLPFSGNSPDLGAFESSSTSPVPAVPAYVSASVENATPARLDINYNLTLANVIPSASAFSVRVNTVARSVSAVTVSGTRVQLTLASPVVYGDVVTVAYTKPSSNPLQTPAGGQAASFTAQNVTNNVAAVNPAYVSASVENATPARLDINYNLTLANVIPSASAFSVRVNTVARSVSAVTVSGTRVQLTLASPVVYGDVVTVAYTKPSSNPLQTPAGGQAASFTAQNVTNNVAAVNPAYVSASVENATPARLDINYNLTLANVIPSASAFSVRVNTVARSVSAVTVSGTRVQLTLASPVVYGDVVTVAYSKPSSNPLQTPAGGQAASFTAQNVTNNVAAVNPAYVSASVENATPARLDINYNLTLANVIPSASAFSVRVNTVARSVSAVTVSGTRVQLTLASPVVYGDVVTVAYSKPSSNPLQTPAGGQAASFTAQNVTNNVAAVNPAYVSASVENATPARLDINYNLTLANVIPSASAFSVRVNTVARSVSAVTVSGTRVQLTLASPVVYGDVVTVAYTKPSSNPLQTPAGGQAASFTAQNVTNNVAAVNPAYVSASVENATPARLDINYNLTLANVIPSASAFSVRVNTVARSVSAVTVSGTRVQLTLASPVVYGDVVTVAYSKPSSNPLQTPAGGQAASFTAQNVTNNVAAVNPAYVSASVENATPARLDINYNLTLANVIPSASAFSVRVNTVARSVSAVTVSGTRVQLTLASPVVYGDVVTVAYSKPSSNPLQTPAGGQAASFTAQNVTNNVAAVNPAYVSASVENATPARLDINYNLTLANVIPSASAFSVRVNTVARSVSAVTVSGTRVQLTLASPVVYGDVVTVAYTKPSSNPLQTAAGGQAASFTAQSVTNNVGAVNQPPLVNISSPTKSNSFIAPATITIDATASDPDGIVVRVDFYQGTIKIGEKTTAPFTLTWKDVPAGTYSITAAAIDNAGARTVSGAVTIAVGTEPVAGNQEPEVIITTPSNNKYKKYKKNEKILIVAEATDPDGSISKVEFKSGDITLYEVTMAPYTFLFAPPDTGIFLITAVATDNLGTKSSTSAVELDVELLYDIDSEIVSLYPNPTTGQFSIDFVSGQEGKWSRIMIVSLTGTVVYKDVIEEYEYSKSVDITDFPAGNYILMISNNQEIVATKKIIKR